MWPTGPDHVGASGESGNLLECVQDDSKVDRADFSLH
jgi:hypothetical protein